MGDKITAIHQPNYFPWIGYFYKISNCDIFVILDNVDFQQGNSNSITNRTKIKCNDSELLITVPVKKNSQSKLIKDITLDVIQPWLNKHLKTIQFNYSKANYYKEIFPLVDKLYEDSKILYTLSELNELIIRRICEWLQIETMIVKSSELGIAENDRNLRLIKICKILNSNIYLSGRGGKKYHDEQLFIQNKINIRYTNFEEKEYTQLGNVFIPGLSILDVLLNCGIDGTKEFLKNTYI